MSKLALLLLLLYPFALWAQNGKDSSSAILLDTAYADGASCITTRQTDHHLFPVGQSWRGRQIAHNLSDHLAQQTGFSQITTGANINKPVFHGMYGNRLLVVVNGLKYDAQQWQDEHGLGLSQIGIKQLATYEQAESAEWGAEAIGGVITVEDESAESGRRKADATVRLHSNTYGTLTDAGVSDGTHRIRWNLRLGYENNADYTDGSDTRVLNSRNKGYYLKSGAGFSRGRWKSYNYYNFSYNQFGFIISDLGSFFQPDDRQSRAISGPHHNVALHFFNSRNEIRLRKAELEIDAGIQSNRRAEDEGGGQISLDVHLLSALQSAVWKRQFCDSNLKLEMRENLTFQTNTNYGARILIPDAQVFEGNVSAKAYYQKMGEPFSISLTFGINDRSIQTFETKYLNAPGKEAQPFNVNRGIVNASFVAGFTEIKRYQLYYSFSTGSRSANLAELSSDGLHEGSYQYEIGRSDLSVEQNFCDKVEGQYIINGNRVNFYADASVYYNLFHNYIFLSPTNELRFGYPVYRYRQENVGISGVDAAYVLRYKQHSGAGIEWQQSYSIVEGVLDDGENLPFMPPARLTNTLQYNFHDSRKGSLGDLFIAPQLQYSFAQNKPAPAELPTPDYALLNLNAGLTVHPYQKPSYVFTLGIRNLLNKTYADHLSRIRYYGLNNQGLNVVLAVTVRLQ